MSQRMVKENNAIYNAISILTARVKQPESYISSPEDLKNLVHLHLGLKDQEVFTVAFLDARHGVIAIEDLFFGSLTGAAVYIGRVARRALLLNAVALVVAHNHPSGNAEPSRADRELTERLYQGLGLLEIRLLDHIIIGGTNTTSFAERGWL